MRSILMCFAIAAALTIGSVSAASAQTGNVSTPQLHFEIRKGSTPVDPMPFLDRGGST